MDLTENWTGRVMRIVVATVAVHLLSCTECLSTGCSYSNSTVVRCVNSNLTAVPTWIPSHVKLIDLSENPFLKLQTDSFAKFTVLKILSIRNCSLNQPLDLPNSLSSIDLGHNSFSMENVAATFKSRPESYITSIHLEGNQLKLDGNLSVFPKSVEYLSLHDNMLSKIEAADFETFTNLKHLSLGDNGIHNVASGAFDKLQQLTKIDLHDNKIENLPKGIFQHNQQLSDINFDNNRLTNIPDLSGRKTVFRLLLSTNQIKIAVGSRFGLPFIGYITLASNKIQSLNLSGLTYRFMDLSDNRISSIEEGSLGENSYISALLLQRNNIKSIKKTSFKGIHFISELHLQSNTLQMIEKGSFQNMNIGKLLLFNNSLTTMNGVMDGMKRQPHLLLLFGNPNITSMRTSDYQNMTTDSQIVTSCQSIKKFSSPFTVHAELICTPTNELTLRSSTLGLEGNGFYCTGHVPYACHPCPPGEFDGTFNGFGSDGCRKCPYGAFYQDEMASTDCKNCPLGQYVPPDRDPGKSPLDCLTCPKGTNTNASAGYRACHCLPGYSRKYRFGACEKCTLEGFHCDKDYPELRAGFWMSWDTIAPCKHSFISFMTNLDRKITFMIEMPTILNALYLLHKDVLLKILVEVELAQHVIKGILVYFVLFVVQDT